MDYKKAGVDIEAGYKAVELMKQHVQSTMRKEVLGGLGGFSGAFSLEEFKTMEKPTLVSGTDGVGTKLKLAFLMDKHDTIGIDCVAMCVNDIACAGGEPLFFLDYIACGKNEPEKIAKIVGEDARNNAELSQKENLKWWLAPLGAVASGVGGAYLGAGIANGDVFGKLSGLNPNRKAGNTERAINLCKNHVADVQKYTGTDLVSSAYNAIKVARELGVVSTVIQKAVEETDDYDSKYKEYEDCIEKNKKESGSCTKSNPSVDVVRDRLLSLGEACEAVKGEEKDKADTIKGTKIAAGVTGGVSAVAGGVLTYFATKSIQQESLDKTQQAAYQKFMDEIGNHIYCYIGGEEAGQYGDVITTSME